MIKGIIFDLDGVLVSTDHYHYLAWKDMADKENIPFNKKINDRLRGVSRSKSLEIILENSNKDYSDKEKIDLMTYKNNIYKNYLNKLNPTHLLPNALEIIKYFKSKKILIAIGSSSKNTKKILDQLEIKELFDVIADGTDIIHSKPNPEVFLIAAKRLNLKPNECAVIEDAIAGIEAAKRANMMAIGINDAKNSKIIDAKIDDLIELKNIL